MSVFHIHEELGIPSKMSLFQDGNLWNLETRKQLGGKHGERKSPGARTQGMDMHVMFKFLLLLCGAEVTH